MRVLFDLCIFTATVAALLTWRVTLCIVRPVCRAVQEAQSFADGDLRATSEPEGTDELAHMLRMIARMRNSLAGVVGKAFDAVESVGVASNASGNLVYPVAQRLPHRVRSERLLRWIKSLPPSSKPQISRAPLMNSRTTLARLQKTGGIAVAEVMQIMAGIDDSSRRISEIVGVIDNVAFQTNILVLNAAVEALRAGEQGRGFGVVAADVRLLAQRCAEVSREIRNLIAASVEKVEKGMHSVQSSSSAMQTLMSSVCRVGDVMEEISGAADSQGAGVAQIAAAVGHLDRSTQQNVALVEQRVAAAESLREQAQRLVEAVAIFSLV